MARMVVDRMIYLPVRSRDGIKLSFDTQLKNRPCLNIPRPGVLHQYFGRNISKYLGQNSSKSNETILLSQDTLMVQGVVHQR